MVRSDASWDEKMDLGLLTKLGCHSRVKAYYGMIVLQQDRRLKREECGMCLRCVGKVGMQGDNLSPPVSSFFFWPGNN